jgi:hypothetical protein
MASRRATHDQPMRQWLIATGCALDPLPAEEAQPLPLQILQGGPAQSTLFRISPGLTGYWLWLQIATQSDKSIRVADLRFELRAAPEMRFALLEPPIARGAVSEYEFPGGFRLPREQVLNHRLPGMVKSDHPWEGFVCGFSFEQLPRLTTRLGARVSLFDDFRMVGSSEVRMSIDPQVHGARRPNRNSKRFTIES